MPTITIYPDPPLRGELLSVSTDDELPKKLTVLWKLANGSSQTEPLTLNEAKENITVPMTAVSVNIHDTDEECADVSRVVL